MVLWDGRDSGTRTRIGVALLDWCGPQLPTCADVEGARVIEYGVAHVLTIQDTGTHVLGNCAPTTGPTAEEFSASASQFEIPVWGRGYIEVEVHSRFGRHFPEHPAVARERPSGFE